METSVDNKIKNIAPKMTSKITEDIKRTLQDDVRREVREIEDQKRRSLNLVILNLPESTSKNAKNRQNEDKSKLIEICNRIVAETPDVKSIFRLCKPQQGKLRPTKIILNNKEHRKEILDKSTKIRDLPDECRLNQSIIVKDLTPQQRELNKERRKTGFKTKVITTDIETNDNSEDNPT